MRFHIYFAALACVCISLLSVTPLATGSVVSQIALVTDGSAEPPGDRIDLTILFEQGETEIEVLVRGFVISGKQNEIATRINDKKKWLARVDAERATTEQPEKKLSIVIPYHDLPLTAGEHQIAYEVVGKIDNRIAFVHPTKLTRVVVTEQTRRKMGLSQTKTETRIVQESEKVILAKKRAEGESPNTQSEKATLQTQVVIETTTSKSVTVAIPGGFTRSRVVEIEDLLGGPNRSLNDKSDSDSLNGKQWKPLSEVATKNNREIWFATNRKMVEKKTGGKLFGPARTEKLHYGSCLVNVPVEHHRAGNIESPTWWAKRDPKKHFTIEQMQGANKEEFISRIGKNDILLFVHGFNNSFEDAIFRTAQLHHDLNFSGKPVAFSWPSADQLSAYEKDQNNADKSVDALVTLIAQLAKASELSKDKVKLKNENTTAKIHIIAHSMGNRVLLKALYEINQASDNYFQKSPFGQIVLAAPDVGAIMFNNLSPHAVALGEQVTYYYCETDSALNVSQNLNKYEPVGKIPYFDKGLFTINANGVGTSFIAHNYYASSRKVLGDIELMLKHGKSPGERMPPLASETKVFGHSCWAFSKKTSVEKN